MCHLHESDCLFESHNREARRHQLVIERYVPAAAAAALTTYPQTSVQLTRHVEARKHGNRRHESTQTLLQLYAESALLLAILARRTSCFATLHMIIHRLIHCKKVSKPGAEAIGSLSASLPRWLNPLPEISPPTLQHTASLNPLPEISPPTLQHTAPAKGSRNSGIREQKQWLKSLTASLSLALRVPVSLSHTSAHNCIGTIRNEH